MDPTDLHLDQSNLNLEVSTVVFSKANKEMRVDSKGFQYSVQIQNTFKHPNSVCQETIVTILGTKSAIVIPLGNPGCSAKMNLRIGENLFEGNSMDLSKFGVNFNRPVQLTCTTKSDRIKIELNDNKVYEGDFIKGIGEVIGTRISFKGTGTINNLKINKPPYSTSINNSNA